MTNVNGNYKKDAIVKAKGYRIKGRANLARKQTHLYMAKKAAKHGKQFKTYAGPTVGMFRKTGAAALGTGKFLVKRGALGFPGLIATGVYYGAKAAAKAQKGIKHPELRQFNKKARKILAGGSYRRGTKIL